MIPAIGIGPLGASEWSIPGISGTGSAATAGAAQAAASGSGSFGSALTNAIGSLENSQNAASTASAQLATGQLTDPTQAVTAVENASLEMDFASQMRNQLTSAATTLFQTQM
ncbi:MAG: flagellar hook-basal body complex protein FliE [Solirubrobacteraceae bacterium]|jgi:flagellar hook-basal body complex protein FliE